MRPIIVAALGLALMGAAPAAAQDYNSSTNYGDLRLSPGFTPDPALVTLRAGGSIDASTRFNTCRGYITEAPDMRLFWDGSGSLSLKISAMSNADTTLVINGPNGEWYCDDDSGEDSNPSVTMKPTAGRYEIWVGTYSSGETKQAVVSISELSSF
jgi:hypothetical protein